MRIAQNKMILLLAALIFSVSAVAAVSFMHSHGEPSQKGSAADVYYCPMHPTYTSDRPGTCPICNMSLVKREETKDETMKSFTVEEILKMKPDEICLLHKCKMGQCLMVMTEEAARLGKCPHCGEDLGILIRDAIPQGYAPVKIGEENRKLLSVKTEPVARRNLEKTIRTSGRVAYDPELYQTQEEYLQALGAFKKAEAADPEIKAQAEKMVESSKIKLRLLGLSDELIKEIQQAEKADRSLLYSDAGGKVWLYAPIYEYEIPFVKIGDQLKAEVPGMPGKNFEGTIRSMDSILDPVTRSARVRAVLDNSEGLLKPEMFVNVVIKIGAGEKLAVPEEAVFATGEKNIVFVAKPGGEFEPREVVLGIKAEDFSEVQSGLSEGELVVTSGNFLIDSESRLKAALEGLGGEGGHQHGS